MMLKLGSGLSSTLIKVCRTLVSPVISSPGETTSPKTAAINRIFEPSETVAAAV